VTMHDQHDKEPNIHMIVGDYFPGKDYRPLDVRGRGVNNTTRFIEVGSEKLVLRIYETHQEEAKVSYEHAVLLELAGADLPYRTPEPVLSRDGTTYVRTAEGKLATVFRYVEGEPPSAGKSTLVDFGEATAHLMLALAEVRIGLSPVYAPYYELEQAHPRCSLAQLNDFCLSPPDEFADEQEKLARIAPYIERIRGELPQLRHLPHQLIHGDLNLSNALADSSGRIAALLDFEFVTMDVRAMEVAVFLSDLIRPDQPVELTFTKVSSYLEGLRRHVQLTDDELSAMPILLLLRRLDVLIHFIGRYWDGVDDRSIVKGQIGQLYAMTQWLDEKEATLLEQLGG